MLNERELGEFIDRRFTRTLFRLETLDRYDVASDAKELRRYIQADGGPDPARKKPWMAHIRDEVARGLHTYRVHVVRSPLTDYLRFEFEWDYVYNAEAGEHIRILDLAERPRPAELLDEDFWLIDDRTVVRMHYDPGGRFMAADVAPDDALSRYRKAADAAWSAGVDFADYWVAHPQYWRDGSAVRR